jgi:hypothetical protein
VDYIIYKLPKMLKEVLINSSYKKPGEVAQGYNPSYSEGGNGSTIVIQV